MTTELAALQERMLAACTGARTAGPAAADVKGSDHLSAEDRLAIYARGYVARLVECLRAELPVLRRLVGDHVFDLFAEGYLSARPPTSHSMFDLGAGFADHLEATRPRPLGPAGSRDALPADLARLERARFEAGRARGVETDPAHTPVDPVSLMTTPGLLVRTPGSLRLLRLDFWLADAVAAADRGDRPAFPASRETFYAVARARYRVDVHVLAPWQHAFLAACAGGGSRLHAAAVVSAHATGLGLDRVCASVLTWLPSAVDAGMAAVLPAEN